MQPDTGADALAERQQQHKALQLAAVAAGDGSKTVMQLGGVYTAVFIYSLW